MILRAVLRQYLGVAVVAVGWAACSSDGGQGGNADARPAIFRDADIYDTADAPIPEEDAPFGLPECPGSCDDKNPCTVDSCDPDTHLCRNDPGNEGASCVSADLCSLEAACNAGLCVGARTRDCSEAPDQCHESGYCVPATGLCSYPASVDRKACDDDSLCTTGDQCIAGTCTGAVVQCGAGFTCDPKTGQCPGFPTSVWGVAQDPAATTADNGSDLAVSPTGALYFTASFANSLDLGAGHMSTTDRSDYNLVVARLDGDTGRASWSRAFGDRAKQYGVSIAANASDVVLVSGVFAGTIDFGPGSGVDAGTLAFANTTSFSKVFFVALDGSSGNAVWALETDISSDRSTAPLRTKVAVDPSDNNFILCGSPNALARGLGVTKAGGKGDVLVAKLSADSGKVIWAGQYGGAADESCDAITADAKGKVYITGSLNTGSSLDLGNQVVLAGPTGNAQKSIYLAQLDGTNGTAVWGTVFGTREAFVNKFRSNAVVTDGDLVWIGGDFSFSAAFGDTTLVSGAGATDAGVGAPSSAIAAFVAALDGTSRRPLWAKNWGSNAEVLALALNSAGDVIVGGYYSSGMTFETGALANPPSAPAPFVAKLKGTTGTAQTARGYASPSSSNSSLHSIVIDRSGKTSQGTPYALGSLGVNAFGIDLGSPVGVVGQSSVDAGGTVSRTLFLVKFNP